MTHYFDNPFQSTSSPGGRKKTLRRQVVLVVEDHEDTRLLYKHVLELQGLQVVEAEEGDQALRLAQEIHPDLVLMDTNLPRVDGLMASKRMREQSSLREVPIVFISGHAGPEYRARALAAGGSDYLIKPITIEDLESTVSRQLGRRNVARAASQ